MRLKLGFAGTITDVVQSGAPPDGDLTLYLDQSVIGSEPADRQRVTINLRRIQEYIASNPNQWILYPAGGNFYNLGLDGKDSRASGVAHDSFFPQPAWAGEPVSLLIDGPAYFGKSAQAHADIETLIAWLESPGNFGGSPL